MPKKVFNKIVGQKLVDGAVEIEDVTGVTLPDIEYSTDEFDVSGLVGALEVSDPTHINAMTFSVKHNNGLNCQTLSTPIQHNFEFRLAQQALNVGLGTTEYKSVKYRVSGYPKKISDGEAERGNPLGSTVDYTVNRYEKEVDGKIVTQIDILAGIVKINGRDFSSQVANLLA